MAVERIGVVGAGAMGTGIAQVAAQAGLRVLLHDLTPDRADAAVERIGLSLEKAVSRGHLSLEQRQAILARIQPTADLALFVDADFVIEAIPEDLALKKSLFGELDRICRPEAVLATNTSSMSITEIGAATNRADRVVGMHFFNPVPIMRLVEIIHGVSSSAHTIQVAHEVAATLGKTAVEVKKDRPGFVVNRILMPMLIEALRVVEEGLATPEEVDKAITLGLHHPMGPFTLLDFTGVDVCYQVLQYLHQELGQPQYAPPQIIKEKVRAGRLGRKVGRGFFDYRG